MSQHLNILERYSLLASIATLLVGRVFYASSSDDIVYVLLTMLVLLMLAANVLVIFSVIYLDWKPADEAHKEFETASNLEVWSVVLF